MRIATQPTIASKSKKLGGARRSRFALRRAAATSPASALQVVVVAELQVLVVADLQVLVVADLQILVVADL